MLVTIHVPGSEPSLSSNQDPDQSKENASIIFIAVYRVNIPLHFRLNYVIYLTKQDEKNAKDFARIPKPRIQDPRGFLPIFVGFK